MSDFSGLIDISKKHNAELLFGEKLAPYTSFKIGGPCAVLLKINDEDCLSESAAYCKKVNIPFRIIGKGSNILVSDRGIDAAVFLMTGLSDIRTEGNIIECGAGALLSALCKTARDNALSGLEFAYGIPGTAGGALYMNAGAYGGEMSQSVKSCRFLNADGEIKTLMNSDLHLSYRHSVFHENSGIILSILFELKNGDKNAITAAMNELMEKRREKQPLDYPSAGSTFKRPPGDYAARLIEECGLKGFSKGGAEVSTKHSGFVINKGGAAFEDIIAVIDGVKEKVLEKTGVMLECEVEILE